MTFAPFFVVVLIWVVVALPLSMANKKAQQARNAKSGRAKPAPGPQPEEAGPRPGEGPAPDRPSVLQPTVTVTQHDDSVYQGSMNAVTGEGYDPCHDEQMASLTRAETAAPAAQAAEPGLQLSWTHSDIVRGFVMGEILNRKQ